MDDIPSGNQSWHWTLLIYNVYIYILYSELIFSCVGDFKLPCSITKRYMFLPSHALI